MSPEEQAEYLNEKMKVRYKGGSLNVQMIEVPADAKNGQILTVLGMIGGVMVEVECKVESDGIEAWLVPLSKNYRKK